MKIKNLLFLSLLIIIGCTKNGVYKTYHEDSNQVYKVETYKNDILDGPFKSYYENGNLKEEKTYKNGIIDGVSKLYLDNGQLFREKNYKNGIPDGNYKLYHLNGQLDEEGTYKNNKRVGTWKGYYDNGQIFYIENYEEDYFYYYNIDGSISRSQVNGLSYVEEYSGDCNRDQIVNRSLSILTEVYKRDGSILRDVELSKNIEPDGSIDLVVYLENNNGRYTRTHTYNCNDYPE
tara:strand:- start:131 stop:829 length:699 start_codon:yes stop_codon:yes gene_type:complete